MAELMGAAIGSSAAGFSTSAAGWPVVRRATNATCSRRIDANKAAMYTTERQAGTTQDHRRLARGDRSERSGSARGDGIEIATCEAGVDSSN